MIFFAVYVAVAVVILLCALPEPGGPPWWFAAGVALLWPAILPIALLTVAVNDGRISKWGGLR